MVPFFRQRGVRRLDLLDTTHADADHLGGVPSLLRAMDASQRGYRWWHSALHSLDFQALRSRPLWDALMLLLLAGATVVTISGAWLSFRVLRR